MGRKHVFHETAGNANDLAEVNKCVLHIVMALVYYCVVYQTMQALFDIMELMKLLISFRNNSVRGLEVFAGNANAYNRLILHHMSISEATEPQTFHLSPIVGFHNNSEDEDYQPIFHLDADNNQCMFQIGDLSEEGSSGEEEPDQAPILWMGLSPPGESGLARRRSLKMDVNKNKEVDHNTTRSNVKKITRSPPKVMSSVF